MTKNIEASSSRQPLLLTILFTILSSLFWGLLLALLLKGSLRSFGNSTNPLIDAQEIDANYNATIILSTDVPFPTMEPPGDFQAAVMNTTKKYGYPLFLYPVSQETRLPADYPNTDAQLPLVSFGEVSVAEILEEPLNQMMEAAKKAGFSPYLRSGFRSIDDQYTAFSRYVTEATAAGKSITEARAYAKRFSAEPGFSEHHLGLSVDLLDYFYPDWIIARNNHDKGLYLWLQQHAYEYGFVISYPAGMDPMYSKPGSGYPMSEPWHLRFVGIELASWFFKTGYLDPHIGVSVNGLLREAYILSGNSPPIQ
jgi:LAS superfamily LD-carboxypeptidase LdcB